MIIRGTFNDNLGALNPGTPGDVRLTSYRALHVNLRSANGVEIASLPVTGPLTDAQLRAAALVVDATPSSPVANDYLPVRLTDGTSFYTASGGSGGGNAAAGTTGTAIPASAGYTGFNSGGNLVGVSTTNPFPVAQQGSVAVTGTFWQATQPVSGSVSVSNLPTTQAVSGSVSVSNFPATQAVSGPLTDAQLRASAVPVSGTFFQATQPVSGTVAVSNFPASQPVTGTFWQSTQPVSLATLPALVAGTAIIGKVGIDQTTPGTTNLVQVGGSLPTGANTIGNVGINVASAASSSPIGSVSIGSSLGKTLVMKTGSLISTLVTADQVILTYTVTAGKTFYLQYFDIVARLTAYAATATNFGTASLENPSGTKLYTAIIANAGAILPVGQTLTEPIPIAAGTVIRIVCTPSAITSMTWQGNLGGYEK
jgi:hypothetical protein